MGWTAPRDWTVGEVVTEAMMDTHIKDNLNYLKGIGQVPTIESGLIIDNTDGDEYVKLPLLSTAECTTVLNVEGEVAHDETTHRIKLYDGTAVRSLVSTADVDDTPVNGATTDPISSNWAYDQGVVTRQFFVPAYHGSGGALGVAGGVGAAYVLNSANDIVYLSFRVPNDFTSLTSVKIIIDPTTTGTFDWTVVTQWGANGEATNTHTDTATADGQAATNSQWLELDISAAYTGLAANDIVATSFTVDVLTTTTSLGIVGLDVKYAY